MGHVIQTTFLIVVIYGYEIPLQYIQEVHVFTLSIHKKINPR